MSFDPATPVNTDPALAGDLELPDPLRRGDGRLVRDRQDWTARRAALLDQFAGLVYGRPPPSPLAVAARGISCDPVALGGRAIRREVALDLLGDRQGPVLHVVLYQPHGDGPFPAFIGPNFHGNQTIDPDPAIRMTAAWCWGGADLGIQDHRATDASRGVHAGRWPLARIIARGHAVATFHDSELFPDRPDGRPLSIQPALARAFPTHDAPYGALATWAWGMSRVADWLASEPGIDPGRIALVGHSRHGKAALWASALDQRFRLTVANNSGCGGAKPARRDFGERIGDVTRQFPHWFHPAYAGFAGRDSTLPVDQHQLLALIAPRALHVASASVDHWADPIGERLAVDAARPVFRLLDRADALGHHLRTGPHDLTPWDWERFLDAADRAWGKHTVEVTTHKD